MAGGNVPAQLAPIFQQASRQTGIPANVLAGIASVESNFGANRGPSSAGAVGLMQFEPGTARGLGINPLDDRQAILGAAKLLLQYGYRQNPTRAIGAYNGGPGNPQYGYAQQVLSEAKRLGGQVTGGGTASGTVSLPPLTSGSLPALSVQVPTFDQAGFDKAQKGYVLGSYLGQQKSPFDNTGGASKGFKVDTGPSALTALYQKGILSSRPPNPQDFQGLKTVQIAHQQLQQIAGTQLSFPSQPVGKTGYVNPIPGANLGRTDMGVDANLPAGHPILALGNSKVLGISPDWYQGQPFVAFQLLDGPAKGRVYYVAEAINPTVKPGQTVRAGQVVGTYNPHGTGLELGWGTPTPGRTLAQAQGNTGGPGHSNSPAGISFRNFLGGLR